MAIRIQWNELEAALLIDTFWTIEKNPAQKNTLINALSEDLRKMATNEGKIIDDKFRNISGISMQLSSIACCFFPERPGLRVTMLFEKMAKLYINNTAAFNSILEEAKKRVNGGPEMSEALNNEKAFEKWLKKTNYKKFSYEMMMEALKEADTYLLEHKISNVSIFDINDGQQVYKLLTKLTSMHFYRLSHTSNARVLDVTASVYRKFLLDTFGNVNQTDDKSNLTEEKAVESSTINHETSPEQVEALNLKDAIIAALKNTLLPMSAQEIFKSVVQNELYTFKVQTNVYEIEGELNRNCQYSDCQNASLNPSFGLIYENGVKKYYYLSKRQNESEVAQENENASDNKPDLDKQGADKADSDIVEENVITPEPDTEIISETDIKSLLKDYFQYGIKIDSIREIIRLRNYAEVRGVAVPESDESLKRIILSIGNVIDGRVYVDSDNIEQELKNIISSIFKSGVQVIYFDSLLEHENEWMAKNHISSVEALVEILQKTTYGYSFAKNFIMDSPRKAEYEIVDEEIKRIWGGKKSRSIEELSQKLPYIPFERIERVITRSKSFVHLSKGVYVNINLVKFTKKEAEAILQYVENTCNRVGYVTLTDIPADEIIEENYELTPLAVYYSIYNKILSDKYQMNDKILTKHGASIDAAVLLKGFISGRDECSFTEVSDKTIEFTGGPNRQITFEALYDSMVRVSVDKFINRNRVNFNVEETDKELSRIITNHFCAIKDITTFAFFPICGMPWNHYLLESYCYLYSKKFSLDLKGFNDKNVGVIVEKTYNKNYNQLLAISAARAGIKLGPETVGQYLVQAGLMSKNKFGNLESIVEMAKDIQEEG